MRRLLLACACVGIAAAPPDRLEADFATLHAAPTELQAATAEARILAAWNTQATASVQLLLEQSGVSLQHGHAADAVADLGAAVDLQPTLADLWRRRAEARFAAGDEQGAVADLAQALAREPRCFPALVDLSRFAEARKDFRGALSAWEALMALEPKAPQGETRLLRLQHKVSGQPT